MISGLAGLSPSRTLSRGSRTREQPPARGRDGTDSVPPANAGKQKPGARYADRVGWSAWPACARCAFSRGKRTLLPPCRLPGRRSVLCRELSRCLYSLASAGDVCWAKPNHAFSGCQQPCSFFFQRRRLGVVAIDVRCGASSAADDGDEIARSRMRVWQMAFFKGFEKAHSPARIRARLIVRAGEGCDERRRRSFG